MGATILGHLVFSDEPQRRPPETAVQQVSSTVLNLHRTYKGAREIGKVTETGAGFAKNSSGRDKAKGEAEHANEAFSFLAYTVFPWRR
jgi:hypothetical protein